MKGHTIIFEPRKPRPNEGIIRIRCFSKSAYNKTISQEGWLILENGVWRFERMHGTIMHHEGVALCEKRRDLLNKKESDPANREVWVDGEGCTESKIHSFT
jgi:hypothetical protein